MTKKERRDLIKEHCYKCGLELLHIQNLINRVAHRICDDCVKKIVKNLELEEDND